jgi:hypothetical protein
MSNYSLQLVNATSEPWTIYLYQTQPSQPPNSYSLAWFAYPMMPQDHTTVTWTQNYWIYWSVSDPLTPGINFSAPGVKIPADPHAANTSTFTAARRKPSLSLPTYAQESHPGSLVIQTAGRVPPNQFAVGIGMNENPTCIVNAAPNTSYIFGTSPTYWIAASKDIQVGTVLDPNTISMNAEVIFPPGIYKRTCTLNQNNQWNIS